MKRAAAEAGPGGKRRRVDGGRPTVIYGVRTAPRLPAAAPRAAPALGPLPGSVHHDGFDNRDRARPVAGSPPHQSQQQQAVSPGSEESGSDSDGAAMAVDAEAAGAVQPRADDEDDDEDVLRPLVPPSAGEHGRGRRARRALPAWIVHARPIAPFVGAGSTVPLDTVGCLSPAIKAALQATGVTSLFPVQAAVVPSIMAGFTMVQHPGDTCVSAPTGSGKTLTYAIPIVDCLRRRVVRQLRALIVLPTRELVQQVQSVMRALVRALPNEAGVQPLAVGVLTGHRGNFAQEQAALVRASPFAGAYESLVDIVIATPGRLVDHLQGTPGLTLEHLRFLVIDEADRLMTQTYQDWLTLALKMAHRPPPPAAQLLAHRPPGWAALTARTSALVPTAAASTCGASSLQKLLFSATLTHDPERLDALHLAHPKLFAEQDEAADAPDGPAASPYALPATLTEELLVCQPHEKPLALLHLLHHRQLRRTLVFVASIEATHRLYLLLRLYDPALSLGEFSSTLTQDRRAAIIRKFEAGQLDVLISSDAMARGVDLAHVENVVCYDVPVYIKTYIHRVGRTARAGAPGCALSILKTDEVVSNKEQRKKRS